MEKMSRYIRESAIAHEKLLLVKPDHKSDTFYEDELNRQIAEHNRQARAACTFVDKVAQPFLLGDKAPAGWRIMGTVSQMVNNVLVTHVSYVKQK